MTSKVLALTGWEGSRLKKVGLDVHANYERGVAWFLGPVEDRGRYFQRLRGQGTGHHPLKSL